MPLIEKAARACLALVCVGVFFLAGVAAAQYDESLFKGMKWRQIGPFRGGRVIAVAGVPGDPSTFYFGAVAGGVWKTTNGGSDWTPLFDKQAVSSIGSIAVAPSDPNVIYVGTGEACIRGNISHGDGVYRSTDAGKTWVNVGLKDTRHIGRVIVHPRNPNILFVAALGHAYGPNAERGVFRSLDAGKTWEKVLYKDDRTGAIDITFDPANPHVLFASLWEASRSPWGMTSGGAGSGLYRSGDDGATWKRLDGNGLPKGILGRIGVSVSGADSNRVYALIEAAEGGLYRSDDGGEKWMKINGGFEFRQRAWYYTHVFADPKDPNTVYILNVGMHRSTDGGHSFARVPAPHGDNHALWIDPANPQRMIEGNDGGATISVDGGKSWTRQDNQPTAQFYHVTTDTRYPYYVYGAQQDNSTVAISSRSDTGVIDRAQWYAVGGCESGHIAVDPRDANIVYAGCYGGHISRFDKRTEQTQEVTPYPEDPMGWGAADIQHRFQWTAPILISPNDPNVLYHAAEVLFRSTNGGMSWTAISPDLTRNDKSKQQASGGPITKDNTSVEYYDTIFALAESSLAKGQIWVGTDDGLVQLTRDGGKNWQNITPHIMPEWGRVSSIEPSSFDAGTAYVAVDHHQVDDFRPWIFKTSDFGKSWSKLGNGIPETTYVRVVREDPSRKGLLYAGTETGIYISFDDGAHWQPLQLNLPTTPIHDLVVKGDDLVVATHGRSFWILDDLAPLRQLTSEIAKTETHLYSPQSALRDRWGSFGGRGPYGQNPPDGAVIDYYLKAAPGEKDEVTLEILDAGGKPVRKFTNKPKKTDDAGAAGEDSGATAKLPVEAGMNRFAWDLNYEDAKKTPGAIIWGGSLNGPQVPPGTYQVVLTVAGKKQTAPLEIKMDPRVTTPAADLQKQFDLLMQIRDRISAAHEAVNQMRDYRAQSQAVVKRLGEGAQAKKIKAAVEELDQKMKPVEEEILQVKSKAPQDPLNYPIKLNNRLAALAGAVGSADAAPTAQEYAVFAALNGQLGVQLKRWEEIKAKEVAALNSMILEAGVPVLQVAPAGGASAAAPSSAPLP
ncbi:MAG: glycosyl hydrolase [Acidipila sp.]|nr:glycosyl hydrolase [Acidipila sp.]